ncbi:MAG: AraC family transcriptional regulator [Verrucomicrobiia bacterium]
MSSRPRPSLPTATLEPRPLVGVLARDGWQIDWIEATLPSLAQAFLPQEEMTLILNFLGSARGHHPTGGDPWKLESEQALVVPPPPSPLPYQRLGGHVHRAVQIRLRPSWLAERHPSARPPGQPRLCSLPLPLLALRRHFLDPPVSDPAVPAWAEAKVHEAVAHLLWPQAKQPAATVRPGAAFQRQKIDHALYLLERDLENPPSLNQLAAAVGCSPFSLSRWFAQETGLSIPAHLRRLRIDKAARLLAQGGLNVTEAAMAVGYSSLSAFNTAFVQQIGCCPGLYQKDPSSPSKEQGSCRFGETPPGLRNPGRNSDPSET